MAKTFYSVNYAIWGRSGISTKWFDNRDQAYAFADHDYRDKPVAHTYRNAASIANIEGIIAEQAAYDY